MVGGLINATISYINSPVARCVHVLLTVLNQFITLNFACKCIPAYGDAWLLRLKVTCNRCFISKSRCIIIVKNVMAVPKVKNSGMANTTPAIPPPSPLLLLWPALLTAHFLSNLALVCSFTSRYLIALLLPKTSTSLITLSLNPAE